MGNCVESREPLKQENRNIQPARYSIAQNRSLPHLPASNEPAETPHTFAPTTMKSVQMDPPTLSDQAMFYSKGNESNETNDPLEGESIEHLNAQLRDSVSDIQAVDIVEKEFVN